MRQTAGVPFPAAPPMLAGVTHADVEVGRHRWHVATAGDGPPVVLLHGWPQHWWAWRHVIPELARTHRVVAPDLRGFGWSAAPPGTYSKMGLARDVEGLLDALGLDTCTLVGHDWGGFVAFLTAIRAPERVSGLAVFSIVHPWLPPERPGPKALLTTSYQLPMATPGLGPQVVARSPFVRTLLRGGTGPGFRWNDRDLALYADAWRRPEHARATAALYRTFLSKELPALLQGRYRKRILDQPIVLATGARDRVVPPARLAGAERFAPALRTEVIEGAGHFVADEQPGSVTTLIRTVL
jgi:pimeloyl-ACP methyl ester carboxylesterase